jgi:ribosomal protein S18 acetylase RimI-like enzyme
MLILRPIRACDDTALRAIEIKCYSDPWASLEFTKFGRYTEVGIADGKIVSYYCTKGSKLLRFAVTPSWQRMGCGSQMIEEVKTECGQKCTIIVPESNEGAHLFLQACGFKCVNTIPKAFTDCGVVEDGYYFLFKRAWAEK